MLFDRCPDQPTASNAGMLRLEPGVHQPEHDHGFARVWFILTGEFTIDRRLCPPRTMLHHPGPSTGERPIYAGRFNMQERKACRPLRRWLALVSSLLQVARPRQRNRVK